MSRARMKRAGLVIIWEFRIRPNQRMRFEKTYGAKGAWTEFFRGGKGRTELLRDLLDPQRYCTLDFWNSSRGYESFRRRNFEEYKRIDQKCEAPTISEKLIGCFRLAK